MITYAHARGHVRVDDGEIVCDAMIVRTITVEQQDGEGGWRKLDNVVEVDTKEGLATLLQKSGDTWQEEQITGHFRIKS